MRFPVDSARTAAGPSIMPNRGGLIRLTGVPRQAFELWRNELQPAGYRLKAMIVEWPQGLPGDVGLILAWGDESFAEPRGVIDSTGWTASTSQDG